jgi:putative ABC transport system substrate-binding protein
MNRRQFIIIEGRSAEGKANLLPGLATELVRLKVDIITALFTPCALAAKQATSVIPIVFAAAGDPLGTGLVASLARPGGNITGLSNMAAETAGKSVELLRDMLPALRRVALLANPADPFTKSIVEQVQRAGSAAGIQIAPVVMVRGVDEAEAAFAAIAQAQAEAVVVQGIFFSRTFADLAIKYRLPSASVVRAFADAGGLMTYGASIATISRRSAVLVHKIMLGARPADLPVEQPTKFELAINLKSAKAMGLTISESFLLRADEVIE